MLATGSMPWVTTIGRGSFDEVVIRIKAHAASKLPPVECCDPDGCCRLDCNRHQRPDTGRSRERARPGTDGCLRVGDRHVQPGCPWRRYGLAGIQRVLCPEEAPRG